MIQIALFFSLHAALASLPPTTSKFEGDLNRVVTFHYEFPGFIGTRNGTTTTLDVNSTVKSIAKSSISSQSFYVAKDVGSDLNDCSIFKPCATIQAGINAANLVSAYFKQTIVRVSAPSGGTGYNENITLSQQGVNLVCDSFQQNGRMCLVTGTLTVNLSGTTGGTNFNANLNESYMTGFNINVGGASNVITFSGTAFQRFTMINSFIDATGTGSAVVVSNTGVSATSVKSTLTMFDTVLKSSDAANPTLSLLSGRFWVYGTNNVIQNAAANDSVIQSGASSSFICNFCEVTGQINVTNNTATATIANSTISSGTQSCIDTPATPGSGNITIATVGFTSSNANTISGSGVLVIAQINPCLSSSCAISSTITKATFNSLQTGQIRPSHALIGGSPASAANAVLVVDNGHTKYTQTTAPTAVVNANAGSGATCTVANATDLSGEVTITTGTVGVVAGNYCQINFNRSFNVAPICTLTPASSTLSSSTYVIRALTNINIGFAVAGVLSSTYVMNYSCIETQ